MTDEQKIFLGSEIEQCPIDQAMFSVLPVPYEKTVSYGGGTSLAPAVIIEASDQLETWDGKSNPSQYGIHTCPAIDCSIEAGQLIENISLEVQHILENNSIPVVLGGEHTVTYGVIKGFVTAGFNDIGIIQIDAHADLREQYEGDPLSHACVIKRIVDMNIPVYQLGIRALSEEEIVTRETLDLYFCDAEALVNNNIQSIKLPDDFPEQVFITIDIDGFDPSVFPSTGTPVPGGLAWYQALNLLESVAKQRKIIGFDLMEFAPIQGFHAYDFAASLLVYKMMGIVQRQNSPETLGEIL